jgi:hypothetical protein
MRKLIYSIFVLVTIMALPGCDKWLDVNTNPNTPTVVDPELLIAPIQSQIALGLQYDARYHAVMVRYWSNSSVWEQHYYVPSSDAAGQLWRTAYWDLGENLTMLMDQASSKQQWDFYGAGKVMRAWAWQTVTDIHGPIILKQAFDLSRDSYDYDNQDVVYLEVRKLCREAIAALSRTDGKASKMSSSDMIYKGDRLKWSRFANGILARQFANLINKTDGNFKYNPDSVIYYAQRALASNADNAYVPFTGSTTSDGNFFGPMRDNLTGFRQSELMVRLMSGTTSTFSGVVDPRMSRILVPNYSGTYSGVAYMKANPDPKNLDNAIRSPFGTVSGQDVTKLNGRYIFANTAPFPLMTYSEMQFLIAEAAYRKGDFSLALSSYKNAISANIDFVSSFAASFSGGGDQAIINTSKAVVPVITTITSAEKSAFLDNPAIVPVAANDLTLSKIMLQKYIALYGYGFLQTWNDLRKYRYSETVYTDWNIVEGQTAIITNSFNINNTTPKGGKDYAYRIRPRYNSEYVWNLETLKKYQGDKLYYHTKPIWFVTSAAEDKDQEITEW